jgi:hypothetical protein
LATDVKIEVKEVKREVAESKEITP